MRTLIHEVIADVDQDAAEIVLLIHWIGGVHNEIRLARRRRGQRNSTSTDIIAAVRQLALIANDDVIAGVLNRNGLVTGHGNRWTRGRVTALRSHHRIPVFKPTACEAEPWLNLGDAARVLKVASKTLRLAAEAGVIEAVHPFCRMVPGSSAAPTFLISRPHHNRSRAPEPAIPTGSHLDQQSLFPSETQTDGCSNAGLYSCLNASHFTWASANDKNQF